MMRLVDGSRAQDDASPGGALSAAAARHYRGRRILVTGAGGSIGRELCRQLLAAGPAELVMLDLSEYALFGAEREMRGAALRAPGGCVSVLGSAGDARLVGRLLERHRIDTVLHAAAYKHVPMVEANPGAGLSNNVLATAVIARAAEEAGVGRFVLVSSDKAIRPSGVMGASKLIAELVVRDRAFCDGRLDAAVVRFGNVLASSGSVVEVMRAQIAAGGPVTLTHPAATRFFMSGAEAVGLVLDGGRIACRGDVLMLDMGKPVRIGDLARRLIAEAGRSVSDRRSAEGGIEITVTGLRPGEKLREEKPDAGAERLPGHPKVLRLPEPPPAPGLADGLLAELEALLRCGDDGMLRAFAARAVARILGDRAEAAAPVGIPA